MPGLHRPASATNLVALRAGAPASELPEDRRQHLPSKDEKAHSPCVMGETQDVFFLRHAESRWNRAQAELSLIGMYSENDHGLSEEGRRQCESLKHRLRTAEVDIFGADGKGPSGASSFLFHLDERHHEPWLKQLLRPDHVLSSPFTRAVQTSLIGLPDIVKRCGQLTLVKEARECKSMGGADSRGVAVGQGVLERALEEIRQLYAEQPVMAEALLAEIADLSVDSSSVSESWWPAVMDTEDSIMDLHCAFLEKLRQLGPRSTAIVIGHSHFFKRFFESHLSETFWRERYDIAASLSQNVIPVCGIVGIRILWDGRGGASVVEAVPLLGTELQAAPDQRPAQALLAPFCCSGRTRRTIASSPPLVRPVPLGGMSPRALALPPPAHSGAEDSACCVT